MTTASNFLGAHEEGCKPLLPCRACQVRDFLKERLKEEGFGRLLKLMGIEDPSTPPRKQVMPETSIHDAFGDKGMEGRVKRCFINERFETVADALKCSPAELLRIPNFAQGSAEFFDAWCAEYGLERTYERP